MTPPFTVRTTPRVDRLARALTRAHPEFPALLGRAVALLEHDPHHRAGVHRIRKLEAVAPGEGQWRLALGRFRFRYDIEGRDVILHHVGLRREDTYR